MPEDAQASTVVAPTRDRIDGPVDAQVLVVPGDDFDERAAGVAEERVVLDQIEM